MSLKNQNIIIFGGSSGIGLATAQLAAQGGANVTIIGRDPARLESALAIIPGGISFVADIANPDQVSASLAEHTEIDHIFVAAGTSKLGSILDPDLETSIQPFVERVWGSIHVVRAAHSKMRGGGSITFTGGLSTDRPIRGAWVSGIGTATVEQLARVLALELAPIRFNAISPGYTDTPLFDKVLGENKSEILTQVATALPVGKIATPTEIAEGVLLLMRNQSITGESLHIDGGARLV